MEHYRGFGELIPIKGTVQFNDHIKVLDHNLKTKIRRSGLYGWSAFQQNSDPKHSSKCVTSWLQLKKITVLPWPLMIPDLNPIENLGNKLKIRICRQATNYFQKFEQPVIEEWKNISVKTFVNLTNNSRKRLLEVAKVKWHAIDF